MPQESRRLPFPYASELAQFDRSFSEKLRDYLNQRRSKFMPAENVHAFQHGTSWKSDVSARPDEISELESHRHEMIIRYEDIIAHDIPAMKQLFIQLGEQIHASVMRMMYSKLGEAADSVGNTVSAKEAGSHANAFLDMLRKIGVWC